MKTIVTVESFDAMRQRKLERAGQVDHGDALASEKRISLESPELLLACMTPQRLRLLEAQESSPAPSRSSPPFFIVKENLSTVTYALCTVLAS